jgi:uncharacterized protein YndB with AHSA1/START domain
MEILQIQRFVPAAPERVFDAWTNPLELKKWWGPKDVRCLSAEVDLRIGGLYRIGNGLPDGTVLWIGGEFEVIERPHLLAYTWIIDSQAQSSERVTVRFEKRDQGTEVILVHERIPTPSLRDQHQNGWFGCLDGLTEFLAG